MERNISMEEISDGKLYGINDMVKAGCGDCRGCSDCCKGMGSSIVLDPYDIHMIKTGLNVGLEQLISEGKLELNVIEGVVLPNINMASKTAGSNEACGFLNDEGRCSIHQHRPGICRLFPLGRLYEDGSFKYFLQIHECSNQSRTKVKVKSWLDTPDIEKYQKFISDWHYFLKDVSAALAEMNDTATVQKINMYLLNMFYIKPYDAEENFYTQFYDRLENIKNALK